jgi:signal transduction histidine kinase/FixJ family two-component response regulator
MNASKAALSPAADKSAAPYLSGGGEMGALIRATDWSKTPIGPIQDWSPSLRMMVSFLLANRFPLLLWWGPQYISIYNDAYRPILGVKHPRALGLPCSECWSEIWHILKPLIDTPFAGGPATWMEDIPLEINRYGFAEETHFTIAYSPVPDETAPRGIGGVLATVHEITEKVVAERRVVALRDLGTRAAAAKTAEEACAVAAAALANHSRDVPFALLYLIDQERRVARLAGAAGAEAGEAISPLSIPLGAEGPWPVADILRREEMVTVDRLAGRFKRVPRGPWSDPPHSAALVPVRSNKAHELAGVMIAGLSPRLRLDHLYRSFLDLVGSQIATSIANSRAYEEERKRAEALAEVDRAKTTFFSNVSHEFRTPLTLMLGPLEEALTAPSAALAEHRDDLALAQRSGLRLLRLVNTLLDFSRIEAGRVQASYEPLDLASITADLASEFRAALEKAGLRLIVECPQLQQPVWVDRDMWEKIVLNLISNAFKFTLQGGIAVRLHEEERNVRLMVEDTGIGIPAHELSHIFDRFHRIENARGRTHEGTGIGLALVQELVKLHGGSVQIDSTPGRGSTFTVTVPRGTAHLPADRLRATRSLASTAVGARPYVEEALRWVSDKGAVGSEAVIEREIISDRSGLIEHGGRLPVVLLVDDNADMREYVRHLLAPQFAVRTVADGAAALREMRSTRPDLVLSDVMMPVLDGFGLVREIRADPALADIPIVLLSARAGEEASIEGLESGADDYLIKPFSARELIARVGANLKMATLRRGLEQRTAADLRAMTLLREVGSLCGREGAEVSDCLDAILDAALAITGAGKGCVQLLNSDTGELTAAAHRGLDDAFLRGFENVELGVARADAILATPLVVEDVADSELLSGQSAQTLMTDAGVRAFVCVPLTNSGGLLLGLLCMHFVVPHRPADRELHFLDLLARQTADYLARKRSQELERVLTRELQHRSNNLLAVVQAIANGTFLASDSLSKAHAAFEARLQALARANRELTNSHWTGLRLRDLLRGELEPFRDRAAFDGRDVVLRPQNAQNFSLALHELITNAAKYGALSAEGGRVALSWLVVRSGSGNSLRFRWQEGGGPPVAAPIRRGFGTSLLKAVCADVDFDYRSEGLRCEFELTLSKSELGALGEADPAAHH